MTILRGDGVGRRNILKKRFVALVVPSQNLGHSETHMQICHWEPSNDKMPTVCIIPHPSIRKGAVCNYTAWSLWRCSMFHNGRASPKAHET